MRASSCPKPPSSPRRLPFPGPPPGFPARAPDTERDPCRNESQRPIRHSYEADEKPPARLAFGLGLGLGLQIVVVIISSVALLAAIVFRTGGAEELLSWGVFAAVLCCGVSTILQALRLGRVGAGYVIFVGASSRSIAVSVAAFAEGGPTMLATLVVVSGVVLIALSARLSLLRRVLTLTVMGTVIMLLPVTVMPILFDMPNRTLPGASAAAGPVSAFATIAVIIGIGLKGTGTLRIWAPATCWRVLPERRRARPARSVCR